MASPSRWTEESEGRLRLLWAEGVAAKAIADELGYADERSVNRRAALLSLPERAPEIDSRFRDWTPERVAELRKLWDEGLSCSQIGKAIGVTRNAVIGKVHRLGLAGRAADNDGRGRAARTETKAETVGGAEISATTKRRHGPKRGEPARNGFGAIGLPLAKPRGRPATVVKAVPVEIPEPDSALAVPFAERRSTQCGWPLWHGEPPLSERLVCGAPVEIGRGHPYCAHHLARSAQAPLTPALSHKGRGGRKDAAPDGNGRSEERPAA